MVRPRDFTASRLNNSENNNNDKKTRRERFRNRAGDYFFMHICNFSCIFSEHSGLPEPKERCPGAASLAALRQPLD